MCYISHITKVNAAHGVCGFTASLCAYYEKSSDGRRAIDNAPNAKTYVRGKISAFLQRIKGTNHWNEIETFTKTFGGFEHFSMATYQQTIDQGDLVFMDVINSEKHHGMAMTPSATSALLYSLGLAPRLTMGDLGGVSPNEKVVGLGKKGGQYNELKHFVYVNKAGIVWNYGEQTTLSAVRTKYNYSSVSCYITC
ncbi:MAG: hypothetical protein ACYSU3_13420 [Planctomycetota bacterium]|jgi:hypothetical protein